MAQQPESARFQTHFEPALRAYEKKAGVSLAQHPLAIKLQNCDSAEAVTGLLQDQARALGDLQGSDRIMKSIKTTVSILSKLSSAASLADDFGPIIPPAKAIQACLAILLDAAKGAIPNCDALIDLLESIERFLNRLDIYTRIPPTPAMDEIVVKILVELISTLGQVTEELKHRRSIKFVNKFLKKDIGAVLERLDRLTQDEARTTAAHTLVVVHGLIQNMRGFMDDEKASINGIRGDLEILHQMASEMNKSKRNELLGKIRKWLSPPNPWKNHSTSRKLRQGQTGAWFINSDMFSEWRASGPSSLLWIHGKPGAGKSVLCSTIIEDINNMQKSGLASLAIFYCDFREDEKKDLRGLLSSVLFQLCDQSDSYYDILATFYSTHRDGDRNPDDDELVRCLENVLSLPGQAPVYLIIDALDECPNKSALSSPRLDVLKLLEDLVDSQLPTLRICVTSRPVADIKPILEPLTFRSVSLHDERGQKEDIENYIKSIVNTNRNMRRWRPEHKQLVIDVLTERADGMFRWVYCQLDYLGKCLPGRVQHALDELPATLDETYERTLQEIDDTNWEFARRLIQCVAVVFRPLTVKELAEFLAFDFEAGQIPRFREDWRLEDPVDAVLFTCSTLLSLVDVEDSQVIQFSHFSVKEFLTSDRFGEKHTTISSRYHVSMTPAHTVVAQACLGILLHLDKDITKATLPKYPLAEYAAEHWFEHARFEAVSQHIEEGMKQLFDRKKTHLAAWLWIFDPTLPSSFRRHTSRPGEQPRTPHGTPLHYAAFCGLIDVVKFLVVEHSADVNSRIFICGESPLHLTSRAGHVDVARLLIEHGADAAAQTKYTGTPLLHASEGGHVDLARLLIEHGASLEARDEFRRTPLHFAYEGGHVDLARLLIEHGANISARNVRRRTPLHEVSLFGDMDLAQLLIEHGADPAAQDDDGWTPLHWASSGGYVDLARFLIEHGADVAAQEKHGWTPLYQAFSRGHLDLTRLLIEHGADAAAQGEYASTPLHCVSSNCHMDLAQFFIEHGADVVARDEHGSTPLHKASSEGHVNLARFLIENGADVASQDEHRSTPLHQASRRGDVDLARLLIEHGADVVTRDEYGSTPLHIASSGGGYVDLVRLLIENGADVAAQDEHRSTPLQQVTSCDRVDLAQLLIEHGADVVARDEYGSTPLHKASSGGHVGLARLLIENGADVAAQDERRSTPLWQASRGGHVNLARLLIEHGADVAAQGEHGSTLLYQASSSGYVDLAWLLIEHGADTAALGEDVLTLPRWVSSSGHMDLARFFIEHGTDVVARDKYGSTPLHIASSGGHVDLTRLLIEHGADVAARDKHGSTPLHIASSGGHVDLVRFLIEHGANVTARDEHGSTPLHLASSRGHVDRPRFFIEHSADVAQNEYGPTPLHKASPEGYLNLARLLIENGADVAAQDEHRSTPLHQAASCASSDVDLAQLLIDHGANVEARDEDWSTPLHKASSGGHESLARLLIEHGADVVAQDEYGSTPLHKASSKRHAVDLARLLIEHGADVGAQDKYGSTPLHEASSRGHSALARLLIEHDADLEARDKDGSTPLYLAYSEGDDVDLAELLIEHSTRIAYYHQTT